MITKVRARYCQLCGKRLKSEHRHSVWCSRCLAAHTINTPCVRCNGIVHTIGEPPT